MESAIAALGLQSTLDLLSLTPPGWGGNLLRGLAYSVQIALGAFALGTLIGIFGAYGKLYGGPVVRDLLAVYTTIVRAVPELILILILYYGADAGGERRAGLDGPRGHPDLGRGGGDRGTGRRAGGLCDRGASRRDPRRAARADRGGARLRHAAVEARLAHHAAGDARLRAARPCEPVADRDEGHGAAGGGGFRRTDAGDAAGGGGDEGLFHLLRGRGGDVPSDLADLGLAFRARRSVGATRRAPCRGAAGDEGLAAAAPGGDDRGGGGAGRVVRDRAALGLAAEIRPASGAGGSGARSGFWS